MEREPIRSLSFVIPVFNEAETLRDLHAEIVKATTPLDLRFEIIFVDDGSRDGSAPAIRELCARNTDTRLVRLGANKGKAAALDAGFRHASGDVIVTLDADLQDDPTEIPRFVEKIREGYDLVSGWKENRQDPWHKTLPSKLYNAVVARVCNLPLHDINCGFKAYRRSAIEGLQIYGELHRFIPALAADSGARITEIRVRHHPRQHGGSKYGLSRLPKGFLDLITILLTTRYLRRPLHFFGGLGLVSFGVGGSLLAYLAILWVLGGGPIGSRPLLFYGLLLAVLGVQLFSLGLIAELILRLGHRGEPLPVAERLGFEDD